MPRKIKNFPSTPATFDFFFVLEISTVHTFFVPYGVSWPEACSCLQFDPVFPVYCIFLMDINVIFSTKNSLARQHRQYLWPGYVPSLLFSSVSSDLSVCMNLLTAPGLYNLNKNMINNHTITKYFQHLLFILFSSFGMNKLWCVNANVYKSFVFRCWARNPTHV